MKKYLAFLFVTNLFLACNKQNSNPLPQPTNGETIVKEDMENPDKSNSKKEWKKQLFRTPPGISAEEIETQEAYRRFQARNKSITQRSPVEELANGLITGQWQEKGSKNQAGSVFKTAYDHLTDELFLISAGGHVWKGGLDGQSWEIINQNARFHNNFIDVVYTENGTRRLLAAIANKPHYSDDEGLTWTVSEGFENKSFNRMKDIYTNEDSLGYTYLLGRDQSVSDFYGLYVSRDKGISYERIQSFTVNDHRDISLAVAKKTNAVFVLEDVTSSTGRLYKMDEAQEKLNMIKTTTSASFGSANGKLVASADDDGTHYLYALSSTGGTSVYLSTDEGDSWTQQGELPTNPWGVGIFVSSENPDYLMYGEVECYRSFNGGQSWEKINGWGEYYSDVINKLHADMMWFSDYKDKDSDEYFMLISNHGGISKMYEYDQEPENFSLTGLNVSQYYSVRTLPGDEDYVFAGSQDQGIQRGQEKEGEILNLHQPLSGDYGHIVFTTNNKMWMVYPDGWISMWSDAKFGGISQSYTLPEKNYGAWIPQLTTVPDGNLDLIYVAGGNLNNDGTSRIIKLVATDELQAYELDFDFNQASNGGHVTAISVADTYEETIYAATSNGKFFYSHDYGDSFEKSANVNGGHYLYGQVIIPSKLNKDKIYTGGTGYNGVPVMRSKDGGVTFEPFGDGLPNTVVLGMALNSDESLLFAATTSGPFVCVLSEKKWYSMMGEAAPDVTYWSVELINEDNTVRFGTYGRGIWDFNISNFVSNEEDEFAVSDEISIYPNPITDFFTIEWKDLNIKDVSLFDMQGKFIESIKVQNKKSVHSIGHLNSGQYIIRYLSKGSVHSKTIIKL